MVNNKKNTISINPEIINNVPEIKPHKSREYSKKEIKIKERFFKIISEVIELNIGKQTFRKFSLEHYLEGYINCLKAGCTWPYVKIPQYNKYGETTTMIEKFKPNHFKTIYNYCLDLSHHNIFYDAFHMLLGKYYYTRTELNNCADNAINLIIDSTIITNYCGSIKKSETIGKTGKKNASKVTLICDNSRVVLDFQLDNARLHDSQVLEPIVKKLPLKKKHLYVIGDKGYINTKRNYFKSKSNYVTRVTEYKSNMNNIRNYKKKIKLLKLRIIIENVICDFKKVGKLRLRFDKSDQVFTQTICFSLILNNMNKLNLHNLENISILPS
jgi:hypothetical protein